MKIVDKRDESGVCEYREIAFGEVFAGPDDELFIKSSKDAEAVKLKNGVVTVLSESERVKRRNVELHLVG